ncbi:FAD-dependent pyridine nucleotide-disulfide oxidoreductase [Anopheles sinensis]|uniref:FAD-dependent pyridine nucleotide-disulfide oxidoreductase n=1 Tax=Anopheles sinensis TaxID=74873 RepID=A0A084VP74_ANOSI|nr:FAD-dependent pyridine nucleotide-disulfide oxidoreductase [Anopheles sinensis]
MDVISSGLTDRHREAALLLTDRVLDVSPHTSVVVDLGIVYRENSRGLRQTTKNHAIVYNSKLLVCSSNSSA